MKIRRLLLFALSLAIITAIPPIQGQTKTLIALKAPNLVNEALEKYAQRIWKAIHEEVKGLGLEFTTVHAKDIHQTLFWGTTDDNAPLIDGAKRAIQSVAGGKMNPFTGIQIGDIERLKTALSVTIQGPGNTKAKQVGDHIERYGTPDFHYLGHISVGRFKLPKTKATGDSEKDKKTIEAILEANPQIMQKIRNISLPDIRSFTFDTLLIKGRDLAEKTYHIDDIIKERVAQKPNTPREQASASSSSSAPHAPAPQQKPAQSSSSATHAPASQKDTTILIALKVPDTIAKNLARYGDTIMKAMRPDLAKIGLSFTYIDRTKQYLKFFEGTTDDLPQLISDTEMVLHKDFIRYIPPFYAHPQEKGTLIKSISDVNLAGNSLEVKIEGPAYRVASEIVFLEEHTNKIPQKEMGWIAVGEFKLLNKDTTDADKARIMEILQQNPDIMQKIRQLPLPQIDEANLTTLLFRVTSGNREKEVLFNINDLNDIAINGDNTAFVRAARAAGIIK